MSRSQKVINVIGIIGIAAGIILTVSGLIAAAACSVLFSSQEIVSSVEGYTEDTGNVLISTSVITVLVGIFDIVVGILSVRAANDADSIGNVCVLSIISLIFSVGYIVFCAFNGGLNIVLFAGLFFSVILVVCAFNIRKPKDTYDRSMR